MNVKRVLFLVLLVVAGGLLWTALHRKDEAGGELRMFGNVDIREVELAFRVPGRLAEVRVDEGDAVVPGQVLATLDARPYHDALDQALAQRDQAAANMAKYRAGNRPQEIAQARARVAQMQAQWENAVRTARRREELVKTGAAAAQDRDDAVASRDALSAQLQEARKALDLQVAGFRVEDVQAAAASLRAAEAAVEAAATNLADTEVACPSAGTVLSRVREPGAMAQAGSTVLVVSLTRPVWVRAYVPEPALGKIHPGMAVSIRTDSRPDKPYAGQVGFISPVAEFTPKNVETESLRTDLVYRLRIVVDNPDEGLRQGMPVTVSAQTATQTATQNATPGAPRSADGGKRP